MKKSTPLWNSISVLTAAVLAILAFVRGTPCTVLLISAFGLWGLWVTWTQALPARSRARVCRQKDQTAISNQALMQTLLHHVNYRVSACLKSAYPEVRWEWVMHDPASFVAQGGTGRIRVFGVPDYSYADVTVEQNGKLSCSLVQVAPISGSKAETETATPDRETLDPRAWYDRHGRDILEKLVADLASRGHHSLTLKEDGSICIQPADGCEEITQSSFAVFPEKACWPGLVKILEQEGLAATAKDTGIIVAW